MGGVKYQSKGGAVCRLLLIAGKAALTHNSTCSKSRTWNHYIDEGLNPDSYEKSVPSVSLLDCKETFPPLRSEAVPKSERGFVKRREEAKRRGCINWRKKLEQKKESWAPRPKKVWERWGCRNMEYKMRQMTGFYERGCVSSFTLNAFEKRIWKRKEVDFICLGATCSNHEFDPFGCSTWWADTQWVHLSFLNCPPL